MAEVYSTLLPDQIRVLEVLPNHDQAAAIECRLQVVTLSDAPYYEAMSWCWGDSTDRKNISVNGTDLAIPCNLYEALKQMRSKENALHLWADAVCIHQSNLNERESQVAMMGKIYSRTALARVWLGPKKTDSESHTMAKTVQTMFQQLDQGIPFSKACKKHLRWPNSFFATFSFFEKHPVYRQEGDKLISALSSIFELPWWTRVWVVQEVVLAPKVQMELGDWTFSYKGLLKVYDNIATDLAKNCSSLEEGFGHSVLRDFMLLLDSRVRPIKLCQALNEQFRSTSGECQTRKDSFLDLIEISATCRTREATDPKDKIYGILGLVPSQTSKDIIPDYHTPARTVFLKTAYEILQSSQSFMLFHGTSGDKSFDLPSWVPDWATQHRSDLGAISSNIGLRRSQETFFAASDESEWSMSRWRETVIQVNGFKVDTIIDMQGLENDSTDAFRIYQDLDNLIVDLYDTYGCPTAVRTQRLKAQKWILDAIYPSGIPIREALARTICNDCVPYSNGRLHRPNAVDRQKLAAWLKGVSIPYHIGLVNKISQSIHFDSGTKASVGGFVRDVLRGKVFFSTKIGYFGLTSGEDTCQNGDEIWIIAGASFPVVLRPPTQNAGDVTAADKGKYLLRSEAYVQGVMHGEAVAGKSPVCPLSDSTLASKIREDLRNGKRDWRKPEWKEILLV